MCSLDCVGCVAMPSCNDHVLDRSFGNVGNCSDFAQSRPANLGSLGRLGLQRATDTLGCCCQALSDGSLLLGTPPVGDSSLGYRVYRGFGLGFTFEVGGSGFRRAPFSYSPRQKGPTGRTSRLLGKGNQGSEAGLVTETGITYHSLHDISWYTVACYGLI